MEIILHGDDIGIFALVAKFGRQYSPADHLIIQKKKSPSNPSFVSSLWPQMIQQSLTQITTRGCLGVIYDHHNREATDFLASFDWKSPPYKPLDRRALPHPILRPYPIALLHHLAVENYGLSVEFNRLARKIIRHCKNHHCDTLIWLEEIFADTKIQKNLQRIAGTQVKVITSGDFSQIKNSSPLPNKITLVDWNQWEISRAESFLCAAKNLVIMHTK